MKQRTDSFYLFPEAVTVSCEDFTKYLQNLLIFIVDYYTYTKNVLYVEFEAAVYTRIMQSACLFSIDI